MLSLVFASTLLFQEPAKLWYGPATTTFQVAFAGNPYDFEKTDVKVRFEDFSGTKFDRPAFFDSEDMVWRAVLVADKPGRYVARLFKNGQALDAEPDPAFVDLSDKPMPRGFIRIDPGNRTRFRYDDGKPYFPIGFNLGWQSGNVPDMSAMIATMGANGVNWSRYWACSWDGKNPWVGKNGESDEDRMLPAAFQRWDQLVEASEKAGIAFQFVLFHHGSFSTRVNPNWGEHPWNKAKGGFLESPTGFFTDPEAKRRTKMWLRYTVARWGHSPSVMAWELFNEVEWVDSRYEDKWEDVLTWHKEMADFLRTTDPYGHLVATSSTFEMPNLYQAVDYYQPHIYPPDVRTAISSFKLPGDKPTFFGEFGPGSLDKAGQRMDVRDGIWAGILSGHAGGGAFWTWEVVHNEKLYGEFAVASKILDETGFRDIGGLNPARVRVDTAGSADLVFNPGTGWAKADKTTFDVAAGSKPDGLGGLPSYLQGPSKRDMFPAPLTFKFNAAKPGVFTLQLSEISRMGATLQFRLNGKQVAEKAYPATEQNTPVADRLTVPFPAGPNEIQVENVGSDWANMKSFTFSGMDAEASGQAIRGADWMMVRLTANPGAKPSVATLGALALPAADYELTVYDLDSGAKTARRVSIAGIDHRETVAMPGGDVLAVFRRLPATGKQR